MTEINLNNIQSSYFKEMGDTASWCEEQYNSHFGRYFEETYQLYTEIQTNKNKLTDSQLEYVLTTLPLNLIVVSETLSEYKLNYDCLKLYIQKRESESISRSSLKKVSEKKEQAALETMEYRVLSSAYLSVIRRVENEIQFSRELIMTAKKIWDSRTKTYEVNSVTSVNELEDFSIDGD